MRTSETMWIVAIALLLSGLGACSPPVGPDQQEAGLEKADAGQPGKSGRPEAPAEMHDTAKYGVLDEYRRCFDSCTDEPADARPTCNDDCATKVSAGSGDPPASACPRSCTKAFGACLGTCGDQHSGVDESCRRQCHAIAENCVDGCG
jgi:hypothetical protein